MAFKMLMPEKDREIEIKIQLEEREFLRIRDDASKIARFAKHSEQSDEYFTPNHRNFVEPRYPFEWLSIRKRGDKAILNYKHWYPENVETSTHCDEFEAEFKDAEKLRRIMSAINFRSLVTVEKEREMYVFEDIFEIAFDKVKGLGYFIEIEALKEFGSVEETRNKLFEFAKKLGIHVTEADKRGYPYALMKMKGWIK